MASLCLSFRVWITSVWHKAGLCWKLFSTWCESLNKYFWLTDQSEALICLCTVRCVCVCACACECDAHIMKSSHCTNQLPQPPTPVAPGYIFYFAERVDRLSPSGALVPFLGRPLNDRCLAVSQIQPWRSPHWVWLNRCPFSHNTPFRLHLPALYSRPALNRTANFCDCKTSVY